MDSNQGLHLSVVLHDEYHLKSLCFSVSCFVNGDALVNTPELNTSKLNTPKQIYLVVDLLCASSLNGDL